jgi:uncharacterized membrane protein
LDTTSLQIGVFWQFIAAAVALPILSFAIKGVPLSVLRAEPRLQHLIYGSIVLLALTWSFRAGLSQGLSIHFLGMTALTLMFGWDLALLIGAIVTVLLTLFGVETWQMFSLNLITQVIIPASLCLFTLRQVEKRMPTNFFIYLFLVAFLGGGVTVASAGLSLALVLGFAGALQWNTIYVEYITYLPLIMLPEGLINGIIMTSMMVFHPDWIRTFDARRYIDEQ